MGTKYTIEAGRGSKLVRYKSTEWFVIAMIHLWLIDINAKGITWKRITVR